MAFVAYLENPELHTNAAGSHAGYGQTKERARKNALYWANQVPWVRTVPASRAPRWALEEARKALNFPCTACGLPWLDADGEPTPSHADGKACVA